MLAESWDSNAVTWVPHEFGFESAMWGAHMPPRPCSPRASCSCSEPRAAREHAIDCWCLPAAHGVPGAGGVAGAVGTGIKANMEQLDKGVVRFTYPLSITEVAPGSEADHRGMRVLILMKYFPNRTRSGMAATQRCRGAL